MESYVEGPMSATKAIGDKGSLGVTLDGQSALLEDLHAVISQLENELVPLLDAPNVPNNSSGEEKQGLRVNNFLNGVAENNRSINRATARLLAIKARLQV